MTKTCLGCGVPLQRIDEKEKGYVKKDNMNFCVRCFRLTHYKEYKKEEEKIDPWKIIKKINEQMGYSFFFIDFVNLHEESLRFFKEIKLPKTLVVSKLDTIPKSVDLKSIKKWLKEEYLVEEPILFLQKGKESSKKKLLEKIESAKEENIFLIGITNAGKSTMTNDLLEENLLTMSELPNTTLDFIELEIGKKKVYDTPGLVYQVEDMDLDFLKKASITKEIHPKTYFLKKEATLNLEEKFFLSMESDNSITWFGSEKLSLKKEYGKNRDNFQQLELEIPNNTNVYFKGIGFFYIKNACKLTILGAQNVSISKSFFKKEGGL